MSLWEMYRSFIAEYYIYMEASWRTTGNKAIIASPTIPVYTPSCLEFYYHMYGAGMGTLKVAPQLSGDISTFGYV